MLEKRLRDINTKVGIIMDNGKKLQENGRVSSQMAGKLSKIDVPDFEGNMRKYKVWKQDFVTLTQLVILKPGNNI